MVILMSYCFFSFFGKVMDSTGLETELIMLMDTLDVWTTGPVYRRVIDR